MLETLKQENQIWINLWLLQKSSIVNKFLSFEKVY